MVAHEVATLRGIFAYETACLFDGGIGAGGAHEACDNSAKLDVVILVERARGALLVEHGELRTKELSRIHEGHT
jgi:hypothetical protein